MGLQVDEIWELRDEIIELYEALGEALKPDEDGKRRVTKREMRKIVRLALELAARIVLEALD